MNIPCRLFSWENHHQKETMINFNQLRAFYEVAKSQSVKDASNNLCVSQPAVSAQIKSFEEFCNLSLFKRKGRKLVLSEAGHLLLQYSRQFFELEKKFEGVIKDLHELRIGILKIGTSKTYARYMVPPHIHRFHLRYPDVKIILDEGSSMQMGRSIVKLRNELAIIGKVEELTGVEFVPFTREKIVLFVSPDHPFAKKRGGIQFKELEGLPIIMRDEGSGTQKLVKEAFSRHGIMPHTLLETGNLGCIKDLVSSGEGLSFLVHSALNEDLKKRRFRIIPILDEEICLEVKIAFLKDQPLSPAAKAFLEILMEFEKNRSKKLGQVVKIVSAEC